jgi:hypothetical protein
VFEFFTMKYRIGFLLFALPLLVGCNAMTSSKLLENPQLMPAPAPPVQQAVNLAIPPQDNLVMADPAKASDDTEEMDLGPDVPSLKQLSAEPVVGIDAGKTAAALEHDIQVAEIDRAVKWRGKVSQDGIDITNVQGILCTGAADPERVGQNPGNKIVLACSDGQVAYLTVEKTGYSGHLSLGKQRELVDLR